MKDHEVKVGDLVRFKNHALGVIIKKHTKAGKSPYYLVYNLQDSDTEWYHPKFFEKCASTADGRNCYIGFMQPIGFV